MKRASSSPRFRPRPIADGLIDRLQLRVVPFTRRQALIAGELRVKTAHLGLSLGDRACLATALDSGGDVVTLDRGWGGADLGVPILLLR